MRRNRLTPQDASFLHVEDGPVHMHIGFAMIFEGTAPAHDEFEDHIASRLHLVPKFRKRLAQVPLRLARPVWVDEPNLDIHDHVRLAELPEPVSDLDLKRFVGRLMSTQLDRTRPLWQVTLVSGLQGNRWAAIGKTHHCLVDGISGVDITVAMCDFAPMPEAPPQEDTGWRPSPVPSGAHLLAEALVEKAAKPVKTLWRLLRAAVREPRNLAASLWKNLAGVSAMTWTALHAAPRTPLNKDVGRDRLVSWAEADLDELKAIRSSLGGTVNDVALAVVAGALRRWLPTRGVSTKELRLKALVPINIRTETGRGTFQNKVAGVIAPLPVHVEDPAERLRLASEAMTRLKRGKQAVGAAFLTQNFPRTIMGRAARLFNVCVTNLPGPQLPMYGMGRELEAMMPILPIARNQALGVAVMSYNGKVFFSLIADRASLPELDDFEAYFAESLDEYKAIVEPALERDAMVAL